jgi:hypothetical protein
LHEQITKERDVNNFLKKHRAWLSKLKQSKTRQREESEEVCEKRWYLYYVLMLNCSGIGDERAEDEKV